MTLEYVELKGGWVKMSKYCGISSWVSTKRNDARICLIERGLGEDEQVSNDDDLDDLTARAVQKRRCGARAIYKLVYNHG